MNSLIKGEFKTVEKARGIERGVLLKGGAKFERLRRALRRLWDKRFHVFKSQLAQNFQKPNQLFLFYFISVNISTSNTFRWALQTLRCGAGQTWGRKGHVIYLPSLSLIVDRNSHAIAFNKSWYKNFLNTIFEFLNERLLRDYPTPHSSLALCA